MIFGEKGECMIGVLDRMCMARQTAQKYFYDSSGYLSGVRHTCLEFDILVWILIYFF